MKDARVRPVEPWIFLFFGLFHLHRVWALIDRPSYAGFWLGLMTRKGPLYVLLMGVLAGLCVVGMVVFLTSLREKGWWRWVYPLCGGYLLFDLLAIATGWSVWQELITRMYDIASPCWVPLWAAFILLGAASLTLGLLLLRARRRLRA